MDRLSKIQYFLRKGLSEMFYERLTMAEEEQRRLIKGNEALRRMLSQKSKKGELIEFPQRDTMTAENAA